MATLEDIPRPVYRTIVFAIALYFGLYLLGTTIDLEIAILAAQVLFGLIAVGFGAALLSLTAGDEPLVLGSAIALVVGGAAQFGWLATGGSRFDLTASLLVFLGMGLYLIEIWDSG